MRAWLARLSTRYGRRRRAGRSQALEQRYALSVEDVVWAMGSFCALNRKPFQAELLVQQFPPPHSSDTLIHAARAMGLRVQRCEYTGSELTALSLPCLVILQGDADPQRAPSDALAETAKPAPPLFRRSGRPAILVRADAEKLILFRAGINTPETLTQEAFSREFTGTVVRLALERSTVKDPDDPQAQNRFGFRWFIPELLKYKHVWRDVL